MASDRITFISSGRADYSMIAPLMDALTEDQTFSPELIVTGTHMTIPHGKTVKEIRHPIRDRVDILMQSNNDVSTANSIGLGVIKFSEAFIKHNPGHLFLIGDRFEILAAAIAAYCLNIPIIHAHAGETTYGSQDNAYRDMISIMAKYYLTAHKEYAERVCGLKEEAWANCYNVGALSVDALLSTPLVSMDTVSERLKIDLTGLTDFFLVTVHPETNLSRQDNFEHMNILLDALDSVGKNYIFTFANQDSGGSDINKMIIEFCKKHPRNTRYVRSAGFENYISMMHNSVGIIGNSSSGIIEAPYFGKRVINIGQRQSGRICSPMVVNVQWDQLAIIASIMSVWGMGGADPHYVFGEKGVTKRILEVLKQICQVKIQ